jgi:hypothetical protein
MKTYRFAIPFAVGLLSAAAPAGAQQTRVRAPQDVGAPTVAFNVKVLESAPLESISVAKNAPFSADAVTEFTQTLGDGNRIERRYVSSIARDSRGRTRREEEIALVGPLGATGPAPRLVTILDPDTGMSYTLDEGTRVAYRNAIVPGKLVELAGRIDQMKAQLVEKRWQAGSGGRGAITVAPAPAIALPPLAVAEAGKIIAGIADPAAAVTVESLGVRSIEGVKAEGTRTTSTIPAGAIGNLMPIEVVSERWFSPELQMAVLITRRDPRAGNTEYRLTNIVRAEPADALFQVPPDYELRDGALARELKKIEVFKVAPKKSK